MLLLLSLVAFNAVYAQHDSLISVKPLVQEAHKQFPIEENIELNKRQGVTVQTPPPPTFNELNSEHIQEHLTRPQLTGSILAQLGSYSGHQQRRQ